VGTGRGANRAGPDRTDWKISSCFGTANLGFPASFVNGVRDNDAVTTTLDHVRAATSAFHPDGKFLR
jgi:hypothetical protein